MPDWEAALIAYVVMLIIGGTEAAPVAVAGSWGFALFMLIDQIGSGGQTLPQLLNGLKGAVAKPAAPSGAPYGLPRNPEPNQPAGPAVPTTGYTCYDSQGRPYHSDIPC